MSTLLKRLNIIQDAIALGEEEVIALQVAQLPKEMKELADLLAAQQYADAALWIIEYHKDNLALMEYQDPELAGLQMELKQLELVLLELVTDKNEYLRKINAFNAAYMEYLGEILEKILQARLEQEEARVSQEEKDEDEDLKEARREYEEFTQQMVDMPPSETLDDEQKLEIRKLFKQAMHKCHPDKLPEEDKEAGMKVFQELQEAHGKQDLERVREIWQKLQDGDWTGSSETVTDKDILRQRIAAMRANVEALWVEIEGICGDETWLLIADLDAKGVGWDVHFAEIKVSLEGKLAEMGGG